MKSFFADLLQIFFLSFSLVFGCVMCLKIMNFLFCFLLVFSVLDYKPLFAHTEAQGSNITVGYTPDSEVVNDFNSVDKKGFGYDLLSAIGQEASLTFNYVKIFSSLEDALIKNKVNLAAFVHKDESYENIIYSSMPFTFIQYGLATKGYKGFYYDEPESIDGKTVATYRSNYGNELFDQYLADNNISVNYVYGTKDGNGSYLDIDADFYLLHSGKTRSDNFFTVLNLAREPIFFATTKDNLHLMGVVEGAYKKLSVEKGTFLSDLQAKYHNTNVRFSNRSLTREESEILREKTFRVGYLENYPPYQYTDSQGNAQGFHVEVMDRLADRYHFKVEYASYDPDNVKGRFDLLLAPTGNPQAVFESYYPSEPYYSMSLIMLFHPGSDSQVYSVHESLLMDSENILQRPMKVGMVDYLFFDKAAFADIIPHATFAYYEDLASLIEAYENRDVDSLLLTDVGAAYITARLDQQAQSYILDLKLPTRLLLSRRLSSEYATIFDRILTHVPQSLYNEILMRKSAGFVEELSLSDFIQQNWKIGLNLMIAAICLFIGFILHSQRKKHREVLEVLHTDKVTKLMSLAYFGEVTTKLINDAQAEELEFIALDIDYFKLINTNYGYDEGTKVIKAVANALVKAYKNSEDVYITRAHTDTFFILKKVTEDKNIDFIINEYIEPAVKEVLGYNYSLSLSVGCYTILDPANEQLHQIADFATMAKKKGKGTHKITIEYFDLEMAKKYNNTLTVLTRLEEAIENKEFIVHYQPKIDFRSMKIIGAEALVRWFPNEGEKIYPEVFIKTMEANGLISKVDLYVFEAVCRYIQEHEGLIEVPIISVNISAVTISQGNIVESLLTLAKQYEVRPQQIEIEITESAMTTFEELLFLRIAVLKQVGFSVAMDDFGTGESSLNRLSGCNVDVLKLDKSMLDYNQHSERGRVVIKRIITLAKELGMKTVAEGVETFDQVETLIALDCDIAQGYYFSRPVNAEAFSALLKENSVPTA